MFSGKGTNSSCVCEWKHMVQNEFPEEYRQHGRRMYMLHQAPAYGMQEGDQITIELETASGEEYDTIQYPSLGDRYALTKYILEKSQNSIAICFGISFLILLNVLTIRSTLMADKAQNKKSLLLLICFWCWQWFISVRTVDIWRFLQSGCRY